MQRHIDNQDFRKRPELEKSSAQGLTILLISSLLSVKPFWKIRYCFRIFFSYQKTTERDLIKKKKLWSIT